jgi:hypothetical protein
VICCPAGTIRSQAARARADLGVMTAADMPAPPGRETGSAAADCTATGCGAGGTQD